ncbi:MAG: type I DNA topoisomerase [Firmicutes bacterium]|nr:type I DNA topoisomerase [Bacillota bacterium]
MNKKALVIVESPSKARTIGRILGSRYKVIASVGHVRDLPKSRLGIDKENNFEPHYINIRGKGDVIKSLKKEAKAASRVLLATDPDREGEAISWHIAYLLGLDPETPCRIEFHEITKNAVKAAVKNPRKIDLNLVDAQQARRVLDRLVGYELSPLLWRKISRGLSAGRVQSAALKILCDREKSIRAFVPEEYWSIAAEFEKNRKKFSAELTKYKGKKFRPSTKEDTDAVLEELKQGDYTVSKVEEKQKKRKPFPPFTTSTLQQEASVKLNFNTKKTMMIAQQLYEGIDIKGRGTVGLVTYIRTDSIRISDEADAAVKNMILSDYGKEYMGKNHYANQKKAVQDAHEAIRPSDLQNRPEEIRGSLTTDQFKLYDLIWRRFVASRMAEAKIDTVTASIVNGNCLFRAAGSRIAFDGYMQVYGIPADEKKNKTIPDLETGEMLKLTGIKGEQHFTQPPPRYTEATLIKELEDKGIGRPSTYAPVMTTLTDRRYVKREKKTLVPQDLGMQVADLMDHYFSNIVDAGFTADMESELDSVETDGKDWHSIISSFYEQFEKDLKVAESEIEKTEAAVEFTGGTCPDCGRPLVLKRGRFGSFAACSGYPDCKHTESLQQKTGVKCPSCGKDILVRRSRKGRIFYGCSGYPECTVTFWNKPVNKKCPSCGSLLTERNGRSGRMLVCSDESCGYKEKAADKVDDQE